MGLLREWRKFGIRDLVVDRERGRIWARVGAMNCKFSFLFILSSFLDTVLLIIIHKQQPSISPRSRLQLSFLRCCTEAVERI